MCLGDLDQQLLDIADRHPSFKEDLCDKVVEYGQSLKDRLIASQTTCLPLLETCVLSSESGMEINCGPYDTPSSPMLRSDGLSPTCFNLPESFLTSETPASDDHRNFRCEGTSPFLSDFNSSFALSPSIMSSARTSPIPANEAEEMDCEDTMTRRGSNQGNPLVAITTFTKENPRQTHIRTTTRGLPGTRRDTLRGSAASQSPDHVNLGMNNLDISVEIGAYLHHPEQVTQVYHWFYQNLTDSTRKHITTVVSLFYAVASPTAFCSLRDAIQIRRSSDQYVLPHGDYNDSVAAISRKLDDLDAGITLAHLSRRCLLLQLAYHKASLEKEVAKERQSWRPIDRRHARAGKPAVEVIDRLVKQAWGRQREGICLDRKRKLMHNRTTRARHLRRLESEFPGLSLLISTEGDVGINHQR